MLIYFFFVLLTFAIMLPAAARLRRDGEVRMGLFLFLLFAALVPYLNVFLTLVMICFVCIDWLDSNAGKVVFKVKK